MLVKKTRLDLLSSKKESWIDWIMMDFPSKRDGKCLPVAGHTIIAIVQRIHVHAEYN